MVFRWFILLNITYSILYSFWDYCILAIKISGSFSTFKSAVFIQSGKPRLVVTTSILSYIVISFLPLRGLHTVYQQTRKDLSTKAIWKQLTYVGLRKCWQNKLPENETTRLIFSLHVGWPFFFFHVFVLLFANPDHRQKVELTPTWFEHAAFWSGVRRATIAPRSQLWILLIFWKKNWGSLFMTGVGWCIKKYNFEKNSV